MKSPKGSGFALGIVIGAVIGIAMIDNLAVDIGPGIAMGFVFESMRNKKEDK
jgi:hypothetical protein